jgi:hypothetical protein
MPAKGLCRAPGTAAPEKKCVPSDGFSRSARTRALHSEKLTLELVQKPRADQK